MSGEPPCVTVTGSINHPRETKMTIQALVWGENVHEQSSEVVAAIHPNGMHNVIAGALSGDNSISVEIGTLQDLEHGLTEGRLARTDVLLWWGHKAHRSVDDTIVERVQKRVC
jgi:trehalose utilization protein